MKGSTWKYSAGGVFLVAGIAVLFQPVLTTADEVSESYSEIEITLEPYSITESYTAEVVDRQTRVITDEYHEVAPVGNYGAVYGDHLMAPGVAYLGTVITPVFTIDRPDARLIALFENPVPGTFAIINAQNRTIIEKNGNRGVLDVPVPEGDYQAKFKETVAWEARGTYVNKCYIRLAVEVVDVDQVTRYREVTKYREVPVQVEKQKEVITYHKVSIIELLLKQ